MIRVLMFLLPWLMLQASDLSVQQLFNVTTAQVTRETIQEKRTIYGTIEADTSSEFEVVSRIGGYLGKVHAVTPFQKIKKGELLYEVYSPELFLAASELLNTLKSDRSELKESIIKKMHLMGVSEKVINDLMHKKIIPEYLPFYSPFEGVLKQINIRQGAGIKAGETLLHVADYSKIWIIARVYEEDLPFLKQTKHAVVRVEGSEHSYKASLVRIYPEVDPRTKSVQVRFDTENNRGELFPGRFATLELLGSAQEGLILPKTAVITKGGEHIVFTAGEYEGEYEPRKIHAKRLGDGRFMIIDGISEGERVVANALFLFDSDATINGLY